MSGTFVKICGITTTDAAAAAVDSGADAIGFVFASGSPRMVTAGQARSLAAELPSSLETVGVFRNQPIDDVLRTARRAGVTSVQLHGNEGEDDFDRLRAEGFDTIRALSIDSYRRLASAERAQLRADRLLLDAVAPGSGTTFDTTLLVGAHPEGFWILAGGLTPRNVAELVRTVRPGGVDVSSGVESSRGIKDPGRIRAFIEAVRAA